MVEEESDRIEEGQRYSSHFELYLAAMRTVGANIQPIKQFLRRLSQGDILVVASESVGLPPAIQEFVCTTFNFFAWGTHILAAAFVYGREAITSSLFTPLVRQLEKTISPKQQTSIKPLLYYFNRHIELDDNEHFPKALQILVNLAGNDQRKWREITLHAQIALQARLNFLNKIHEKIQQVNAKIAL